MAVPKRRTSSARRDKRRAHDGLALPVDAYQLLPRRVEEADLVVQGLAAGEPGVLPLERAARLGAPVWETAEQRLLGQEEQIRAHGLHLPQQELPLERHHVAAFVRQQGTAMAEILQVDPARQDRKSTRLNSSHMSESRMPSSA